MPNVPFFGTLQPRVSPLVQSLQALQPLPGALRETADSFLEYYASLGPAERQQLEASPNFGRMMTLARIFRPGSVGVDEQGRPRILLSRETLQQEKDRERQESINIVAPIAAAEPEQQELLIQQRQEDLRRAAEMYPSIVYQDPQTGLLRPAIDRTTALQWQGMEAEVEQTKAATGLTKAQTQQVQAAIDQAWKGLEIEAGRLGLARQELEAQKPLLQAQTYDIYARINLANTQEARLARQWEQEFDLKKEESAAQLAMQQALNEAQINRIAVQNNVDLSNLELQAADNASLVELRHAQANYQNALAAGARTDVENAQADLWVRQAQAQTMLMDSITRQLDAIAPLNPQTNQRYLVTPDGRLQPVTHGQLMEIYDAIGRGVMGDAWNSQMVAEIFSSIETQGGVPSVGLPGEAVPPLRRREEPIPAEKFLPPGVSVAVDAVKQVGDWILRSSRSLREKLGLAPAAAEGEGRPPAWPELPPGYTVDDVRRRLQQATSRGPLSGALAGGPPDVDPMLDSYITQLLETRTEPTLQEKLEALLREIGG